MHLSSEGCHEGSTPSPAAQPLISKHLKAINKIKKLTDEICYYADPKGGDTFIILAANDDDSGVNINAICGMERQLCNLLGCAINSNPQLRTLILKTLYLDSMIPDEERIEARKAEEVIKRSAKMAN